MALLTGGFGCWIDLQSRVGGTDEPTIFALLLPKGGQVLQSRGGIAQLARALAWHARGPGFESPYLHNNRTVRSPRTVFFWLRSSMDRIRVSGTLDAGSIPAGATTIKSKCTDHQSLGFLFSGLLKPNVQTISPKNSEFQPDSTTSKSALSAHFNGVHVCWRSVEHCKACSDL